ncbi:helix-turn-helix transcriptional regulator [Streptomyces sp. GS7]|uniref:helix-turn-helix transcriptional regulator n=1 Tax=Streptomyces sp. GS7 TaxID=2692234 RepID=UPI00131954B5|nr:WYL domain-containing protein [Streptomyces sp. GS7]QHC26265.1 WYL domain-containing protein [Streptomyces sp. GS7]
MTADLPARMPLPFDAEEAVALAVALRAAATCVSGIEETAVRALAKLEQALPARLRDQVSAVQHATVSLPFDGAPKAQLTELTALAAACRDHEIVTFAYESRDGTPSTRRVEPHTLIAAHGRWYLAAYDLNRDAWRTFRVDRLTDPAPTGLRVPPRRLPAPDAAAYLTACLAATPARYRAQATVLSDAETVRTRTGAFPSRVRALDDHTCTVDLSADDPLHIALRILTLENLGRGATLHGSPELAPHIEEFAHHLADAARALTPPHDAHETDR